MTRNEHPAARVERALEAADVALGAGDLDRAMRELQGAALVATAGPVRRELRVSLLRAKAWCHLLHDEPQQAQEALAMALELARVEAALAEPVRAARVEMALMAGEVRRAKRWLAEQGRERRATLLAEARLELWRGDLAQTERILQAAEQAPGGRTRLTPPTAALRALVAIWEGRPEQARMLYEGVATGPENPHWNLVHVLTWRLLWVTTGDARYLEFATGLAEQLRFARPGAPTLPGLRAAAAAQHAFLLAMGGHLALATEAAAEALGLLGALTLPEWPRAAILHDVALVFRDAGQDELYQRTLDMWAETHQGDWASRMVVVSGPRGRGALGAAAPAADGATRGHGSSLISEAALRVIEARKDPYRALLRTLADELGASGAVWVDSQERELGRVGTALHRTGTTAADDDDGDPVTLAAGSADRITFFDVREAAVGRLDSGEMERLVAAVRSVAESARVTAKLRDALEVAEARRGAAVDALERNRRGGAAALLGGRFQGVAGRSPLIGAALDRLAALGRTTMPIMVEGPMGSGRRHLARALAADLGGNPDQVPMVDATLLTLDGAVATLERLEAQAGAGVWVVGNAGQLGPDAASWLIQRAHAAGRRGRLVVTLDASEGGPIAGALRTTFAASSVALCGLDERLEDLPVLIDALAVALGHRAEDIGTGARAVLARKAWPGHVAELRSMLAHGLVRASGKALTPEHLEGTLADEEAASMSEGLDLGYHDAVKSFRRRLLRYALETTGGNRTRAARMLGVQRTYFMRLIRDLGADDIPPAA